MQLYSDQYSSVLKQLVSQESLCSGVGESFAVLFSASQYCSVESSFFLLTPVIYVSIIMK